MNCPPPPPQEGEEDDSYVGIQAFTPSLRQYKWSEGSKLPHVTKYEPKDDPAAWIEVYSMVVRAVRGSADTMVSYVPIMLGSKASRWLHNLPLRCIDSWKDFADRFIKNFKSTCDQPKTRRDLEKVRQCKGEQLCDFIKCFTPAKTVVQPDPGPRGSLRDTVLHGRHSR